MIRPANTVESTDATYQDKLVGLRLTKGLRTVLVEQLFSPQHIGHWQKNAGLGAGSRMTRSLRLDEFPWPAKEVEAAAKALFAELRMSVDADIQGSFIRLHVSPSLFIANKKTMETMYAQVSEPKHDIALLSALFDDLSRWHEANGKRVCYLSLQPMGENMSTITPKVRSIFATLNIPPESLTVKDAEVQEAHRGEVHVAMPAQLFDQYALRMKEMLRDVKRAQGAGGLSAAGKLR